MKTCIYALLLLLILTANVFAQKQCAFGFKPVEILDDSNASSIFAKPYGIISGCAGTTCTAPKKTAEEYRAELFPEWKKPTKLVCPYERAIEKYGEDRVIYRSKCSTNVDPTNVCPQYLKQVLIDGTAVYEKPEEFGGLK